MAMEGWIYYIIDIIYKILIVNNNFLLYKFTKTNLFIDGKLNLGYNKDVFNKFVSDDDEWYYAFIGDLLGDGNVRLRKNKNGIYTSRFEFTFSKDNLPYLRHLKFKIYSKICTISEPTPWPNPKSGKPISEYWFCSRYLAIFVKIHHEWYKKVNNKYIKIIPKNIQSLLKPIGLTHWIMSDGYCKGNTIYICTDCYTFSEVNLLVNAIRNNFNIWTTLVKRNKNNNMVCWRIKIPNKDIHILRNIVKIFMIPEMLYKLNIK